MIAAYLPLDIRPGGILRVFVCQLNWLRQVSPWLLILPAKIREVF